MTTGAFVLTHLVKLPSSGLERSRWRGGRFAWYYSDTLGSLR
jgi:hypothetical protein